MNKRIKLLTFILFTIIFQFNFVYAVTEDTFSFRLKGGIIAITTTVILWIILGIRLLKQDPKQKIEKVADNYKSLTKKELEIFKIDSDNLKLVIFDKFKEIHNAWQNFDYDKLRENLSEELFKFYVEELEKLRRKNRKNIIKEMELVDIKFYNIRNVYDLLHIDIYLCVRMYDYVVDMFTCECLDGLDKEKFDFEYELTFIKDMRTKCPKCGWFVSVDDVTCKNCQADVKIKNDNDNYILSYKRCVNKMKVNLDENKKIDKFIKK